MGKRQEQAQMTRQKIICAAKQLFFERGYENISVSDIAQAAGVAKGSFYTYFEHKEDIIRAITNEFDDIRLLSLNLEGDVCQKIYTFLTASMARIVRMGISITREWMRCAVVPQQITGMDKLGFDLRSIEDILAASISSGELVQNTPVDDIAHWICAEYYGLVSNWCITDGAMDPVSLIEKFCTKPLVQIISIYSQQAST